MIVKRLAAITTLAIIGFSPTALAQNQLRRPDFFLQGDEWLDQQVRDLQNASQWRDYRSLTGRFTVRMPGEPASSIDAITLKTGEQLELQTFSIGPGGERLYVVLYGDVPRSFADKDPKLVLTQLSRQVLNYMDSDLKIVSDQPITLKPYPGREVQVQLSQSSTEVTTIKFYLVERRLYIIGAQTSRVSSRESQMFFDSFQVLPTEQSANSPSRVAKD